jgi:hypothetical protein
MNMENALKTMSLENRNSFLAGNPAYSYSLNDLLAYKIEYRFYSLRKRKEYCVFCNEKIFKIYGIEIDIFKELRDLQINIFERRKIIKPICWYCGMLIMKILDKINEK